MSGFSPWVEANWFNLIQTVGIVGGLWMNAEASNREAKSRNRDAKAKEVDNILTLAEHHGNLWSQIEENPRLQRVLSRRVDASKNPVTLTEEVFINKAFVQYLTGWRIVEIGGITTLKELTLDVRWFFTLPLPRAVWEESKGFKNPDFVRFVDRAIDEAAFP